jgi:hypothetical protein
MAVALDSSSVHVNILLCYLALLLLFISPFICVPPLLLNCAPFIMVLWIEYHLPVRAHSFQAAHCVDCYNSADRLACQSLAGGVATKGSL